MPTYRVVCPLCEIEEDHFCSIAERHEIEMSCGHIGKLVIMPTSLVFFHEGWYEHITDKPIYIRNKKQLKEACEKHDVTSVYLEDSC